MFPPRWSTGQKVEIASGIKQRRVREFWSKAKSRYPSSCTAKKSSNETLKKFVTKKSPCETLKNDLDDEAAAQAAAMALHADKIQAVFKLIATLDKDSDGNTISKDEYVRAHGGDFKMFDDMKRANEGEVTKAEFEAFLAEGRVKKGHKGDKWIRGLLETLCEYI